MVPLKIYFKEIVGFIFRYSGMYYLIREIICRNKATIVVYHDPKPALFERHIRYLSLHYNIIPLNELIIAIYEKDWKTIPVKSLIMTIDDGRKGNYKLLEIFKTYNIKPMLFLCSHIVNTNRHLWWQTGCSKLESFKRLHYDQMLKLLYDQVDYRPDKEYKERQVLNKLEIIDMLAYVDFGAHTKYHPILTNCPKDKCFDEIADSKRYLEELIGEQIDDFAYPNGYYSSREIRFVKDSGYRSARTLDVGWIDMNSDPYRLKVMEIQDNASLNILCTQISGLFPAVRTLRVRIKKYLYNLLKKNN